MGRAHNQRLVATDVRSRANGFTDLFGERRGEQRPRTLLRYEFARPLDTEARERVEGYVRTRLTEARPRCRWTEGRMLLIDCARAPTREAGIIRLHLQQLADVTAFFRGSE